MFISTIQPGERERPQRNAAHYKTMTDFSRFRRAQDGELVSPIKKAYNQPSYNHFSDLTVREAAGINEKSPFGIDLYITPKYGETHQHKDMPQTKLPAWSGSKNVSFIDKAQNAASWKPGPNTTSCAHQEWLKEFYPKKGCFGKYKRHTFTEDVQKHESSLPAPNSYVWEKTDIKHSKPQAAFKL